jgi:hypothetical protein
MVDLTCFAYTSPPLSKNASTDAFWILSGIHGEEPAGPNALAENVDLLLDLHSQGIPIVFLPLLNPLGYCRDDRYFDAHRDEKPGHSVTDSEHLLPDITHPDIARQPSPSTIYADTILKWTSKTAKSYPPLIVVDHHEDELDHRGIQYIDSGYTYSYGYGIENRIAPLCKLVTELLKTNGFPVQEKGVTRFGERITNGFVLNSQDGSIDEYLAFKGALASFVIETTRDDEKPIPLNHRIKIHKEVMKMYPKMWSLLN